MGLELLPERIRRRIVRRGDCLVWTGAVQRNGYGYTRWKTNGVWKHIRVHRLAYLVTHGQIPAGREVHHRCKTRACMNPDHLEAVTHAENVKTRRPRPPTGATRCRNGHLYTPETTKILTASGARTCRRCQHDAKLRYRARQRALRDQALHQLL